MKLTPFGKLFLALIILGVIGFAVFKKYGNEVKQWAGVNTEGGGSSGGGRGEAVSKDDFGSIGSLPDAPRDGRVNVKPTNAALGGGKLDRPLKVAINTWAGHAPGIVANGGLSPG